MGSLNLFACLERHWSWNYTHGRISWLCAQSSFLRAKVGFWFSYLRILGYLISNFDGNSPCRISYFTSVLSINGIRELLVPSLESSTYLRFWCQIGSLGMFWGSQVQLVIEFGSLLCSKFLAPWYLYPRMCICISGFSR